MSTGLADRPTSVQVWFLGGCGRAIEDDIRPLGGVGVDFLATPQAGQPAPTKLAQSEQGQGYSELHGSKTLLCPNVLNHFKDQDATDRQTRSGPWFTFLARKSHPKAPCTLPISPFLLAPGKERALSSPQQGLPRDLLKPASPALHLLHTCPAPQEGP